jgi:LacI family transcriptional regulator
VTVTIKEVALRAGVSITTVSRVLNEKLEGVGKETRVKVLQVMKEMDYQPNSVARSMITKRTGTIGLIIPDITNPFFPELARGVEDGLEATGMNLILSNTDGDLSKEQKVVRFLAQKSVDGYIVTSPNTVEDNNIFQELYSKGIPVVFIERYQEGRCDIPSVYFQNEEGARLATKHLIEIGHRKIACVTGPLSTTNAQLRLKGFRSECAKAGIEIPEEWIGHGNYKIDGGYQAAKQLLTHYKHEITAIFASNDLMAFGALKAAKEAGLNVPGDLAICGFDNIYLSEMVEPCLTTIDVPGYSLGNAAAKMLTAMIMGKEIIQQNISFAPQLVIRKSSLRKD